MLLMITSVGEYTVMLSRLKHSLTLSLELYREYVLNLCRQCSFLCHTRQARYYIVETEAAKHDVSGEKLIASREGKISRLHGTATLILFFGAILAN